MAEHSKAVQAAEKIWTCIVIGGFLLYLLLLLTVGLALPLCFFAVMIIAFATGQHLLGIAMVTVIIVISLLLILISSQPSARDMPS